MSYLKFSFWVIKEWTSTTGWWKLKAVSSQELKPRMIRKEKMYMHHLPQLKNPKPPNAVHDHQTAGFGVRAVVMSKLKMGQIRISQTLPRL